MFGDNSIKDMELSGVKLLISYVNWQNIDFVYMMVRLGCISDPQRIKQKITSRGIPKKAIKTLKTEC